MDVTVVLSDPHVPDRTGILLYEGVLLDVSYRPAGQLESAEAILGDYHLANTFRTPNVILDPTGRLARLEAAVSMGFAERRWVYKRREQARDKVLNFIESLDESAPIYDQILTWLFATGITTHVLLTAGLKSPTVKRRYLAVRELLAEYGRLDFYEALLDLLGCAHMSRARVEQHLAALMEAFDAAKEMIKSPFFFASEISDIARPLSIGGSRDLIEHGFYREAIFWIAVTYSRCRKVLDQDAPEAMRNKFSSGYRDLLADLGVTTFADVRRRSDQLKSFLPSVWELAETVIEANPEIVRSG
jgi:hypothetical protein